MDGVECIFLRVSIAQGHTLGDEGLVSEREGHIHAGIEYIFF